MTPKTTPTNWADTEYLDLVERILHEGRRKGDRTGTGTLSLFGEQLKFNLRDGFPLLTTKKIFWRGIVEELLWFLRGSTNEHELREKKVHFWKEWATPEQCARFGRKPGDLGPIYGHQWRNFGAPHYGDDIPGPDGEPIGIDQIREALNLLANSPESRRILVSGWNPAEATKVALPPCHTIFQFETHEEPFSHGGSSHMRRVLSCHMYQRSADIFLGVPFNIASYALLTHMFAHVLGYEVGDLIISFGDVHIYSNHIDQVNTQLEREPREAPHLIINADHSVPANEEQRRNPDALVACLLGITFGHLTMANYKPHPKIAAEVAV